MQSFYQASFPERSRFPALSEDRAVRVCVIGGGYAGLYAALGLAERGLNDVCLLEAQGIGHGASGRNGGFVFAGYSLGEGSLRAQLGESAARALYARTRDAVNLIRQRIAHYRIDCDLVDAGVLWVNWFADPRFLSERQQLLASSFDSHWEWVERARLREWLDTRRYSAALFERNAMHLHPLKLAHGLARAAAGQGVRIHEDSRVGQIDRRPDGRWQIRCNGYTVIAEHIVIACGGYLAGLVPALSRAVMPIATYVMSSAVDSSVRAAIKTDAAIYDTRFAFDYYRRLPDSRLLWGGRISIRDRPAAAVARLLRRDLLKVYPQLHGLPIEYSWSGLMSYARHEMPQLGQLQPGFWFAQGFGGHGLAPTAVAGELLAAAIASGDQSWREFARYGLSPVYGAAGRMAAQLSYSWLQLRDRLEALRE